MYKLLRGYSNNIIGRNLDEESTQRLNRTTIFEPMRANRYLVTFPQSFNIPSYFIRTATRPSISVTDNQPFWDDMTFELYDPINPSMSRRIYELIEDQSIYGPIVLKLQMLDPTGVVISDWTIYGRINSISYSDLDYSNDDITSIIMNMSVSNALLHY